MLLTIAAIVYGVIAFIEWKNRVDGFIDGMTCPEGTVPDGIWCLKSPPSPAHE